MRTILRRLQRIENALVPSGDSGPLRVRYGELKPLPADYTGERHTVITNLRREPSGQEWCDFEERPGPKPQRDEDDDDNVLYVRYVESGESNE
jgi:hypothetical protein